MVKLTAILNWNGYHNIPKKYIQRAMFKGVVYGSFEFWGRALRVRIWEFGFKKTTTA